MIEQAVVLGATGGVGKAVVDALLTRNIPTKILVRNIEKFKRLYQAGEPLGRVSVIEGDLDNNQALAVACENVDTIFACFNAPYHRWSIDMPRWVARIGDIASALGANIVFPGNVYNYGLVDPLENPITEEYPQKAHTHKGQLRIALEARLISAAIQGASTTILRFPDFFGPAVLIRTIEHLFSDALKGKKASWYGNPSKKHQFIYTKDAGEAMVRAALEPKSRDSVLHVAGTTITASDFIKKIYELAGAKLADPYRIVPSWQLKFAGMLSKEASEFTEMLYLFEDEIILDETKFKEIVGSPPSTPIDQAIDETLEWFRRWKRH